MSKNYDLSSKSDMNKFISDLKKDIIETGKKTAEKDGIETTCTNCGASITIYPGKKTKCPKCGTIINAQWSK